MHIRDGSRKQEKNKEQKSKQPRLSITKRKNRIKIKMVEKRECVYVRQRGNKNPQYGICFIKQL